MMQVRRTAVAWDATLTRVEYVDHEGNPYYCCFEPRDSAEAHATETLSMDGHEP
jgi:hypothetical protein